MGFFLPSFPVVRHFESFIMLFLIANIIGKLHNNDQDLGWLSLSQFRPLRYFSNFSVIKILVTHGISRSYLADVTTA